MKPGLAGYDLPWDEGRRAGITSDFHAEDTIIPDFMPATAPVSSVADDVRPAAAVAPAASRPASVPDAAPPVRYGRMLAFALAVVLLGGAGAYFFGNADESSLILPEPAVVASAVSSTPQEVLDAAPLEPALPSVVEAPASEVLEGSSGFAAVQADALPPPLLNPVAAADKPQPQVRPKPTDSVEPRKPASPRAQTAEISRSSPRPDAGRSWQAALQVELAGCDRESFFSRIACREKVRWRYCAPDRWNTAPGCEANASQQ